MKIGHPDYPVDDWKYWVLHDKTLMGYWDWVEAQINRAEFEEEELEEETRAIADEEYGPGPDEEDEHNPYWRDQ